MVSRNLEYPSAPVLSEVPNSYAYASSVFRWAEGVTKTTVAWYLWRKTSRARWSKACRVAAIALGVGGGIVPLLHSANSHLLAPEWGFVLLAAAAGLVLVDRLFGFSSSWMRFMRTQASLQAELVYVQARYLIWCSRVATTEVLSESELDEVFGMVRDLVGSSAASVLDETSAWADDLISQIEKANPRLTLGIPDAVSVTANSDDGSKRSSTEKPGMFAPSKTGDK
jgi:hypothetical protein